jgi:3'-phosphoadenosine 5'-phosphosulfate sulfotransferase (PAPS reductase)/FAD synthetase
VQERASTNTIIERGYYRLGCAVLTLSVTRLDLGVFTHGPWA